MTATLPVGNAYTTPQSQIGLAIEATKGTAPSQPTYMVPVRAPKYKVNQAMIPDESLQGSQVEIYDMVLGLRDDEHGWDGYPYLDSFPLYIAGLLGSPDTKTAAPASTTLASSATAGASTVSATASVAAGSYIAIGSGASLESNLVASVSGTGPYTLTLTWPTLYAHASSATVTGLTKHQWSLLNNANNGQPPSLSIWDYDGEEWRILTAGQLNELTLKGNATGLVEYTSSWLANPALLNQSAPSTSFTSVQAVPGWSAAVSIGGGSYVSYVEDWEFDFSRGTEPIPAITGTQEYFQYLAGPLQCPGKVTVVEQSGSPQLAAYVAGTTEAFDFNIFDKKSGYILNIHSDAVKFKAGEIDRSKKWVSVPLEFQLLPTSTDATAGGVSPLIVSVGNAVTSAYN